MFRFFKMALWSTDLWCKMSIILLNHLSFNKLCFSRFVSKIWLNLLVFLPCEIVPLFVSDLCCCCWGWDVRYEEWSEGYIIGDVFTPEGAPESAADCGEILDPPTCPCCCTDEVGGARVG